MKDYLKILSLDEYSTTPVHVQIANGFLKAIENGTYVHGDTLPTSKKLASTLHISAKLVERIYNAFLEKGVFVPIRGKVSLTVPANFQKKQKLIVLLNIFSGPEKLLFDTFAQALTGDYIIDLHIYNNDYKTFKRIVNAALRATYLKFVILPTFEGNDRRAYQIINTIPKEKLVIIDQLDDSIEGDFNAVYEDFEKNIYEGLQQLNDSLSKYSSIKLLYPDDCHFPRTVIDGFSKYCLDYAFEHSLFNSIDNEVIKANVVYVCLSENDVILFVDKTMRTEFKVGRDIGVISYHETLVKKLILRGMTTISIDLKAMGNIAAAMVKSDEIKKIRVHSAVICRPSL